jgi:Tol biopolymer transport system component
MDRLRFAVCGLSIGAFLAPPAASQGLRLVSVATDGTQGDNFSDGARIAPSGRFVVFRSAASTLVPGDTNGFEDVFLHDRLTRTTECISVSSAGVLGNSHSESGAVTPDGRYVAFTSISSNLAPGDTNSRYDVFVRDRVAGTTERVSVSTGGAQGDQDSEAPSISDDGRYVAFDSRAGTLVAGDTNLGYDVFVRDRQTGTTERVSLAHGGGEADGWSLYSRISPDGRYVAFESSATNLVPGDGNGMTDIFVRDLQSGTNERVSLAWNGAEANGHCELSSMSSDGRCVVFTSRANNLVPGDTNVKEDVFLRDRLAGTTERISVDSNEIQGDGDSFWGTISASGRWVAFASAATNLVHADTNFHVDVFVRDRLTETTERVGLGAGGVQGNADSAYPEISADGRFVAFSSLATNLVAGDTNFEDDVFLADRNVSGFNVLCWPGAGFTIGCPCSNPPSGPNRGCDNSSGTGGAILSASGMAYVASDDLVFTTSDERPTATSVVLQGTSGAPLGIVYGQGLRCAAGTLRRLFVKAASGGAIRAPDFGAGDPSISARSTALGDPIQPGSSRWYLVYYRDPTVLGGCPAGSTFNATPTGQIDWSF